MPISVHYFSSSRSMPIFIKVAKVVLLVCMKSALIMSSPTRTINKAPLKRCKRVSYFCSVKNKNLRISARMLSASSNVQDVKHHILGKQIDAVNSDLKNTVVKKVVQRFIATSSTASTSSL